MSKPVLDAPLPQGLLVQHEADGLCLSYRWFSPKHLFMAAFCVFWDGFLVFWQNTALENPGPSNVLLWFPLLHVGVGIGSRLKRPTLHWRSSRRSRTTLGWRTSGSRARCKSSPWPCRGAREGNLRSVPGVIRT